MASASRADYAHGEAVAAGRADHRAGIAPVIGLPGYPLATAVIFELFGAPMLTALAGQDLATYRVRARLDRDWVSPADVEDWVLVTLTPDAAGGLPLASPARRGAGSISQLARADAWWPIPGGKGTFTAGTQIEAHPDPPRRLTVPAGPSGPPGTGAIILCPDMRDLLAEDASGYRPSGEIGYCIQYERCAGAG